MKPEYREVKHDIYDANGEVIGFSVSGELVEKKQELSINESGVQYFGIFMDGGYEPCQLVVDQPVKLGE